MSLWNSGVTKMYWYVNIYLPFGLSSHLPIALPTYNIHHHII